MPREQLIPTYITKMQVELEKYLRVEINGQPWRIAGPTSVSMDPSDSYMRIEMIAYPLKRRKRKGK